MAGQRLRAPVQCVEPRYSESARAKAEAAVVDHIYQRLATITGRQPLFVAHYKLLTAHRLTLNSNCHKLEALTPIALT